MPSYRSARRFLLYGVLFPSGFALAQSPENATAFAQFRPRHELPGQRLVGREVCAGCHGQKSRSQSHTSMAHALHIAAESNVLRSHPRLNFQFGVYSYQIASEGPQVLYRVTDGKQTISEPILYLSLIHI